jgi:hypothetical protein
LIDLDLDFNRLTSLNFPSNLTHLGFLHLRANQFNSFNVPAELIGLTYLDVRENSLTNFTLPGSLNHLASLGISKTKLTQLTLPLGLTNLTTLFLTENPLTNLVLPSDLYRLESLNLGGNELASLTLPSGLTNLVGLFVTGNQLTSLTLPPDMTQLIAFGFLANPLTTFVLSEPLAATNLAEDVASLRDQGVSVFTYPLTIQLTSARKTVGGAFEFALTGPPGIYTVLSSTNLAVFSALGITTNQLGAINFTDATSHFSPQKFYGAARLDPPPNMVFRAEGKSLAVALSTTPNSPAGRPNGPCLTPARSTLIRISASGLCW